MPNRASSLQNKLSDVNHKGRTDVLKENVAVDVATCRHESVYQNSRVVRYGVIELELAALESDEIACPYGRGIYRCQVVVAQAAWTAKSLGVLVQLG